MESFCDKNSTKTDDLSLSCLMFINVHDWTWTVKKTICRTSTAYNKKKSRFDNFSSCESKGSSMKGSDSGKSLSVFRLPRALLHFTCAGWIHSKHRRAQSLILSKLPGVKALRASQCGGQIKNQLSATSGFGSPRWYTAGRIDNRWGHNKSSIGQMPTCFAAVFVMGGLIFFA